MVIRLTSDRQCSSGQRLVACAAPGASATMRLRVEPGRSQPLRRLLAGLGADKELRRQAIGRHPEVLRRGEVALGHRPAIAIAVALPVDQQRIGPGGAWDRCASGRARAAGGRGSAGCRGGRAGWCSDRPGAPRPTSGAIRREAGRSPDGHSGCGSAVGRTRRLVSTVIRDTRMGAADGPEERSGEEDVADRAEANRQDIRGSGSVGHGQKVQRER